METYNDIIKTRIVAVTAPTISECNNINEFIAYTARVSNPKNQNNKKTSAKLIKYLADHKHWSPFEMATLVMEITTTRDISRQILRHRSFSFQEFSQRYGIVADFVLREPRLQDFKNRQNSINLNLNDQSHKNIESEWIKLQEEVINVTKKVYKRALELGIAKEQARTVLPEGNTITTIYMSGTIRSWIHYCQVRCGKEVQKEHRQIAVSCWQVITDLFPNLSDLIEIN